ncbi:MAG TPA: sodium ion-translocating decarboxylase subunit beta [Acidilobales archaeon]|nr:sodium ion-translocating decarboxylase subunit beta [Acidilobales archaeon]
MSLLLATLTDYITKIFGLVALSPEEVLARVVMAVIGTILLYLGYRKVLEPLIMIPMGIGMITANLAFIIGIGNPHVNIDFTNVSNNYVYWLQPFYSFMFSNGLIACLVFLGIGVMTDITFLMAKPYTSLILAIFAELGTIITLPIAVLMGFNLRQAAAIALIGGADGPIVLYSSLKLAPELFVPITVVGYLYLSMLYIFQEKLDELTIPKNLLKTYMDIRELPKISPKEKLAFSVIITAILSILFPQASPLIVSFFAGVIIKEIGISRYIKLLDEVILSLSTFLLAFVLGTLTTVDVIFKGDVLKILILGILALTLSSIGGSIGGIVMYYASKGKINPLLGPAAVSCVPTTAKISQKVASKYNPRNYILAFAMGPNIAGVITTAIIASIYIALFT